MTKETTGDTSGGLTASLMPLINGFMASRMVHVAAELGIADLLAQGAKSTEVLARETGTDAPMLRRLLRALASFGVIDELEPGRFALNVLGEQLRTGVPGSVRNLALTFGSEQSWRSWGELRHSIVTGAPAMRHVFGMEPFEYLAAHPQQAARFNEAMAEITRQVARSVVAGYDFAPFCTIVDVGGGNGTLIVPILQAAPKLRGIVFDSPSGSAEASRQLEAHGLSERCEVIAGDFFSSVPRDADAYILKSIIHDWDDDRSVTILRNCREAISADGKLLLIERVMPARIDASGDHQPWTMLDMHMLVMIGGRERTKDEFQALLAASKFNLKRTLSLPGATGFSLIEAIPA
jgi:O-methyltransferase domain/Dimerisation domain